ncbi:Fic family protein [Candidatus Dojkabacteria bacterium]|nr:Fic family protein [Candidatus Dojkabacteria bacterium]
MQPFKPHKLPIKELNWVEFIPYLGNARDRLAKFDGLLQGIPNPRVLLSPLTTKEAVLSSKIEGTQATLEEVLKYEANHSASQEKTEDIKEVLNYRQALMYAIDCLDKRPLSERLIKEVHKILLKDVRSNTGILGEFRDGQVFIGKDGTTIEAASFVPPKATDIPKYFKEFEKYLHYDEKDPLIQLAIIHAQFEIIHPFWDGNGRVGRILMPLFLFYKKVLTTPMFYLSEHFELNRTEYYAKLKGISKKNDWDSWIIYFLNAVAIQSEINSQKAKLIHNLYNKKKEEISQTTKSKYSFKVLDFIFSYPIFNSSQFYKITRIKGTTAKDLIKKIEKNKIIKLVQKGSGKRANIYLFPELLSITES